MLVKHIDLVERRIIKGETIGHDKKLFSIIETYTECITKGKQNPSVELGKNFQLTTDQFNLIVDCKIMENVVDKTTVISLADRVLGGCWVGFVLQVGVLIKVFTARIIKKF